MSNEENGGWLNQQPLAEIWRRCTGAVRWVSADDPVYQRGFVRHVIGPTWLYLSEDLKTLKELPETLVAMMLLDDDAIPPPRPLGWHPALGPDFDPFMLPDFPPIPPQPAPPPQSP